jgi:PPOX class probable F420-dependent enzyme
VSALRPEVATFLDGQKLGVLATVSADGRPRQSVVYFARDGQRLLITTEAGRWKARDAERTGWASLCVRGSEPPYPSATLAGPATIQHRGIGSATARIAQQVMGLDEPPEPQPEEALAAAGRVILAITVEHVGPVTYIEPAGE